MTTFLIKYYFGRFNGLILQDFVNLRITQPVIIFGRAIGANLSPMVHENIDL